MTRLFQRVTLRAISKKKFRLEIPQLPSKHVLSFDFSHMFGPQKEQGEEKK